MNTIASNRQNDRHGPDIATVIDRAAAEMKEHSPGTALIDGLMADSWDGGDPWGSTLEAWFAENGNLALAAQRLNVHRNTLSYRLQRIEALTGCSFEDPHDRLNISVALLIRRLSSPA